MPGKLRAAQDPLNLALDRARHRLGEHHAHDVAGDRAQLLQRVLEALPVLGGMLLGIGRAEDLIVEEPHEGLRDRARMAAHAVGDGERVLERDAELEEVGAGAHERRAGDLEAVVGQRHQDAELLGLAHELAVERPEARLDVGRRPDLGLLGVEGTQQGVAEAQHALGAGDVEDALDRAQVHALGAHLGDEAQAADVVGPVEARTRPDLGRGQQTARLIGPDVAHGHAGGASQLVDGQLLRHRGQSYGRDHDVSLCAIVLCNHTPMLFLAASEPAKGASIHDLIIGAAVGAVLTIAVLWVASAHRNGRIRWLGRLAGFSERVSGLPGWCALPSAIVGGSLFIAVFGFYWDVAKHIDTGRDPSPFGTPAHYPILVGLAGIALGGLLAIVLGAPREVPTSVHITRDWHAPLGGVLIFLCGAFALSGFPLDDVWHTLFGQDVTLWGPTHVLMIAGASLSGLGVWVLLVEGRRAVGWSEEQVRAQPLWRRLRTVMIAGGFLVGLSTLQGEFDYGVPQFQLVFQPILIMLAAGVGLVTARLRLGRFGALQAVASFLVIRGLFTLVIGPGFGLSTLHMPLYIVEAILVELVALAISREKALTFGAVSGVLIGTVGLAAEWGWSHVWMPLPWPSALLPEAAILGFAAAVAGGVLGGYVGRALISGDVPPQPGPRWLLPAAA